MTYQLLRSLYFGSGANADITADADRAKLHVATPLDDFIPTLLREGLDVVLTGNPGDGKSHLAKALAQRGGLEEVVVELDLSANTAELIIERWSKASAAGTPFLLCANEGPLTALISALLEDSRLRERGEELSRHLGRLVSARADDLPAAPRKVALIDLADRNVADRRLISRCLERVCSFDYLPDLGAQAGETSAGANLALFIHAPEARERLGTLLEIAGRRRGEHVTFRQLWGTIAYALCADKDESALEKEVRRDQVGLGTLPLDNLCKGGGRGLLIDALSSLADPAEVPIPDLDEAIWSRGEPRRGEWLSDEVVPRSPAGLWSDGKKADALAAFKSLKRHATLAHEEGARVIEVLQESDPHLPSRVPDAQLHAQLVAGVRGLYLSPSQQAHAPEWQRSGVPLWVSNTYADAATEQRPHVATDAISSGELTILRPHRAPWLSEALGPPPEVAWLSHEPSGVSLRADAAMVRALSLAAKSDGPVEIPEPVSRFLTRIAGHVEAAAPRHLGEDHFAVLERPRGAMAGSGAVRHLVNQGAEYVSG